MKFRNIFHAGIFSSLLLVGMFGVSLAARAEAQVCCITTDKVYHADQFAEEKQDCQPSSTGSADGCQTMNNVGICRNLNPNDTFDPSAPLFSSGNICNSDDHWYYIRTVFSADCTNPSYATLCKQFQPQCNSYTNPNACNLKEEVCFWFQNVCHPKTERLDCSTVPQDLCGTVQGTSACAWNEATGQCIQAIEETQAGGHRAPPGYVERGGSLPACAFEGTCRNVNDLLQVVVNYSKGLFGFFGAFAFLFFIYGGFMMVISMGNPEKFKQGRDLLVSAVIGIIIIFSAYVAVGFILDALQVSPEFREIGSVTTK